MKCKRFKSSKLKVFDDTCRVNWRKRKNSAFYTSDAFGISSSVALVVATRSSSMLIVVTVPTLPCGKT